MFVEVVSELEAQEIRLTFYNISRLFNTKIIEKLSRTDHPGHIFQGLKFKNSYHVKGFWEQGIASHSKTVRTITNMFN
jgi:hypothetical protein